MEADLAPWAGQSIRLKLAVDVGPQDNSTGDWAAWADCRIESLEPILSHAFETMGPGSDHEKGPYPVKGLRLSDIASARKAWLRVEGMGVEGVSPYVMNAWINGLQAGALPASRGDERKGLWPEAARIPLSQAAIRRLSTINLVTIENPGKDFFKLRRFWIELELADGRKASSSVNKNVYTQPPEWPYAEGICVSFGDEISAEIRFDVE